MFFNILSKLNHYLKNILSQRSQNHCLTGFITRGKPNQLVSISIAIDTILPLILNRGQHTQIAVPLLLEPQGYFTIDQARGNGSVTLKDGSAEPLL